MQIWHIWKSGLGEGRDGHVYEPGLGAQLWKYVVQTFCREHGIVSLGDYLDSYAVGLYFVDGDPPIERALDLVELTFGAIDRAVRQYWNYPMRSEAGITQEPDDAIDELNHRFLEHGVGYQFESGKIVRLDTTYAHAEVIKPALAVLADPLFKNAQAEFLKAHEAYRNGRYSDSLNESLKAFESTMKIICAARGWSVPATATAQVLIDAVLKNGLLTGAHQQQLTSVRTLLESGTPTVRNKNSGHGQGTATVTVRDYVAAFGLQTAAANISLLVAGFHAQGKRKP